MVRRLLLLTCGVAYTAAVISDTTQTLLQPRAASDSANTTLVGINASSSAAASEGIDVLDTPVRIITLRPNETMRSRFQAVGFRDVDFFSAVDMRGKTADNLLRSGLISSSAYTHMTEGCKRHNEIPSGGAVGVYKSHLGVCSEDHDTLAIEDDAFPFARLIPQLTRAKKLDADVVVFGPLRVYPASAPWMQEFPSGEGTFEKLGDRGFWGLHCTLYTARGCKRMRQQLDKPVEQQIDHAIGFQSRVMGSLDVYVETSEASAIQEHSGDSSIQKADGGCNLCDVSPKSKCLLCMPWLSLFV